MLDKDKTHHQLELTPNFNTMTIQLNAELISKMETRLQFSSAGLPNTIEEATRRYIHHFRGSYQGPADEEYKLANMTQALILDLRKRAPNFYQEKLTHIINQACNQLIKHITETQTGFKNFCLEHQLFMAMLLDFRISQPSDYINYRCEFLRLREKLDLTKQQKELQLRLEQLQAQEISTDDIGEEDFDNEYVRICDEMDKVKDQLNCVSLKIDLLDGVDTQEEAHFELNIKPRSILSRLSVDQLEHLEDLLLQYVKAHHNKRTGPYIDMPTINGLLAQLNINPDLFKIDELPHMTKEVFDAYNDYFRKIELSIREENLNQLCKSAHLLPKDGIIIKGPDDIPEEVKVKLEQHSKRYSKEFSEIVATFGERPCSDEHMGDMLDEFDEKEEDCKAKLMEDLRMKGIAIKRVKEDPTENCDLDEVFSESEDEPDSNSIAQAPNIEATTITTCAPAPTYAQGPVNVPAPGPVYPPGLINVPVPGQPYAPGPTYATRPTYAPGPVNVPAPAPTYAPGSKNGPAYHPGSAHPPAPASTYAPKLVCTPTHAYTPIHAYYGRTYSRGNAYAPAPISMYPLLCKPTYAPAAISTYPLLCKPTYAPAPAPAQPPPTHIPAQVPKPTLMPIPAHVPSPELRPVTDVGSGPVTEPAHAEAPGPGPDENVNVIGGGTLALMTNVPHVPDVPCDAPVAKMEDENDQLPNSNSANNEDDDDDDEYIECLGIVEPADKIKTVDLN